MSDVTVGLLIFAGMLGVVAVAMIPAYLRSRIPWKKTPAGITYHSMTNISPVRIDEAIIESLRLLRTHSDIRPQVLDAAAMSLRVIVQRVDSWNSPQHGGNVAGVTHGATIYVGLDLAAVCHEIAHVCEFIEGGAEGQDLNHRRWVKRGIQHAANEFERNWVK